MRIEHPVAVRDEGFLIACEGRRPEEPFQDYIVVKPTEEKAFLKTVIFL